MKLTPQERERYRKEYDSALISGSLKWNGNPKNKESFERAINYWLNLIDTILEERVEIIRGEILDKKVGDDKNICYCSGHGEHKNCERSSDRMIDKILNLPSLNK